MILSDRSIREELGAGRIVIEPLGANAVQPSSVDLHVDRYFRVFRNDTTPYIDPKEHQEDLTELVEVKDDGAFILHPGEFVLGSTLERVALPDDLVARLEGKSSLGRLGLLIHSSLPGSESVFVFHDGRLEPRPIEEVVRKQQRAFVASFDPDTFAVDYREITGWYEGPSDRIYEVRLASGRRVRLTAGHNLFTLDPNGEIRKVRTGAVTAGTKVAIPRQLPDVAGSARPIEVLDLVPDSERDRVVCTGPSVAAVFDTHGAEVRAALRQAGYARADHYRQRARLPLAVAMQFPELLRALGADDRLDQRGARSGLPARIVPDFEFAWFLGMFVAEGHRRVNQFTVSDNDQARLDRLESILSALGVPVHRSAHAVTGCSSFASNALGWIGTGGKAPEKRVPAMVFGWPRVLIEAFVTGLVDGVGSVDNSRTSIWTTSEGLVGDLLLLFSRLGVRAGTCWRDRGNSPICQVYVPHREHELLTSVPLPDQLLVDVRTSAGLAQNIAARSAGSSHATGDLLWDAVVSVTDTGVVEPIFDLEVRPGGRHIENFLAGDGGVFVSNTAGFVDAGWNGHLTLELSNVANLPIALYPGMKIGQISFLRMTTAADVPYGSQATGSKYQGQRGPTPSRYYLNFADEG